MHLLLWAFLTAGVLTASASRGLSRRLTTMAVHGFGATDKLTGRDPVGGKRTMCGDTASPTTFKDRRTAREPAREANTERCFGELPFALEDRAMTTEEDRSNELRSCRRGCGPQARHPASRTPLCRASG